MQRLQAVDGCSVADALKVMCSDASGEIDYYRMSDLRYDLKSGWLVLDTSGEASQTEALRAAVRTGRARMG